MTVSEEPECTRKTTMENELRKLSTSWFTEAAGSWPTSPKQLHCPSQSRQGKAAWSISPDANQEVARLVFHLRSGGDMSWKGGASEV